MNGLLDRSSTLLISTNNESVRTKLNRIDTKSISKRMKTNICQNGLVYMKMK